MRIAVRIGAGNTTARRPALWSGDEDTGEDSGEDRSGEDRGADG